MEKPFKISVVIGTRPEAIKLAALIIKFKKNKNFHLRIILTGQHKEMVNQVMNLFDLKADPNCEIMKASNETFELVFIYELNRIVIN